MLTFFFGGGATFLTHTVDMNVYMRQVIEENDNGEYIAETHWTCVITVPLLCAFISRYQPHDLTPR